MRELEQDIQKSRLDHKYMEIPDSLDEMILNGITRAKSDQIRKQRYRRRTIWSSAVVFVFFVSFVLSIRFSPTFAAMVRDIPGMEGFVNLIHKTMDRGVRLAVDYEYIQPIGISDEHDGYKFTVEGIIADDTRMVVFYSIDNYVSDRFLKVGFIQLINQNGERVGASIGFNHPEERKDWEERYPQDQQGMIDIRMVNGEVIPEQVSLRVTLFNEGEVPIPSPSNEYNIHIPIDHTFFRAMKEEYEINQTIDVEGERIHFLKAVVHPLQIELHVQFDPNNRRDYISAADMRFVDKKGNEMRHTHNSGPENGKQVLYFESNYFHKPKQLWLEGELFRALEKGKTDLVIDTNKKQLLQAPDHKISVKSITKLGATIDIVLELEGIDPDDNMLYSLMNSYFLDADGNQHLEGYLEGVNIRTVTESGERGKQEVHFYINNEAYAQPLTFKLVNYPNYIREKYSIQVK